MLHFISNPAYQNACRQLSRRHAEFQRSNKRNDPRRRSLSRAASPDPKLFANEVYQCVKLMELRRLDMAIINDAMQNNLRGDPWLNVNQFRRLFSVLTDMERLSNGEQI